MNNYIDNKRPIEQIFVAKPSATTSHTGDVNINTATGAVDLVEGQIKIYDSKGYGTNIANTTLTAGDDAQDSPEIFIVVGNKSASDPSYKQPYPLPNRPYEVSESITSENRILYKYSQAKLPTWNKELISNINVGDELEYSLKIALFGRDQDEAMGAQQKPDALNVTYGAPDFTELVWDATKAKDAIVQNLVAEVNKNSLALSYSKGYRPSKPIIAFAINTAGGSQGVNPRTITPGTAVPVINTSIGIRSIVFSTEMINSFITSTLPAGAKIIPVDTSLAGGFAVAGTALKLPNGSNSAVLSGKADAILIMALDRDLAYEDRIPYVKNRVSVGLTSGFNTETVVKTKIQDPFEGQGLQRQLDKFWRDTAGGRIYNNYRGFETMRTEVPSPVTEKYYDVVLLEHFRRDQIDGATTVTKPFRVYLYLPVTVAYVPVDGATPPSVTKTVDVGAAALVANILKPWVVSTSNPIVLV
jgi:hypothetical protein